MRWLFRWQVSLTQASGAEINPDSVFFQKAISGGISEVNGGEMAQRQAKTVSLQNLAAMLVKDHTAALTTLRAIAAAQAIDVPTTATIDQLATPLRIKTMSDDTFDKSHIEWQIGAHQDAIAMFKPEIASGDDVEGRQFATATLPTLQEHLAQLYAVVVDSTPPAAQ